MNSKKGIGMLIATTLVLSCGAGMKLAAKDMESKGGTELKTALPDAKEQKKERPQMDLAFCIDTTGSMQGEIDMVKEKVKSLTAKLCTGKPAPIVRIGLVAFRDRGDTYVTRVYPFTDDVDSFVKDISSLQADGGGDEPEAVNEALHAAVHDLTWSKEKKTAKLLFLIGDAGPSFYVNDFKWNEESSKAIAQGIQINTIGCDGLESSATNGTSGVDVFKQIAKLTDGQFEMLAYKTQVTNADGSSSTVIRSGGESYEVADAASREWKKGARALEKAGMASRLSASTIARPMAMPAAAKARYGGFAAGAPGGGGAGAMAADMMVTSRGATLRSIDRGTNNLDEIMFGAALKKAKDKLNVEYK